MTQWQVLTYESRLTHARMILCLLCEKKTTKETLFIPDCQRDRITCHEPAGSLRSLQLLKHV
jgi:hypothetical protein